MSLRKFVRAINTTLSYECGLVRLEGLKRPARNTGHARTRQGCRLNAYKAMAIGDLIAGGFPPVEAETMVSVPFAACAELRTWNEPLQDIPLDARERKEEFEYCLITYNCARTRIQGPLQRLQDLVPHEESPVPISQSTTLPPGFFLSAAAKLTTAQSRELAKFSDRWQDLAQRDNKTGHPWQQAKEHLCQDLEAWACKQGLITVPVPYPPAESVAALREEIKRQRLTLIVLRNQKDGHQAGIDRLWGLFRERFEMAPPERPIIMMWEQAQDALDVMQRELDRIQAAEGPERVQCEPPSVGAGGESGGGKDKANKKTNTYKPKLAPITPKNPMVQKLLSGLKNPKNKNKTIREIAMGITEDDEKKAKSIEAQVRRYLKATKDYELANKSANT